MFEDPLAYMSARPGLVVAIVFAAGAAEYVFPPFWGDTVMLLGAFMAGLDRVHPAPVFVAAFAGSCAGALAAYGIGRHFGRASLRLVALTERTQRFVERAEKLYAEHGSRVLAFNRFLPGVRAVFLPLAGIGNVPARRVLVWSSVSNLLYCGLVLAIGVTVGSHTTEVSVLQGRFRSAMTICAVAAFVIVITLTIRHVVLRRRCSKAC